MTLQSIHETMAIDRKGTNVSTTYTAVEARLKRELAMIGGAQYLPDLEYSRSRWIATREHHGLSANATDIVSAPNAVSKLETNVFPTCSICLAQERRSLAVLGEGFNTCPMSTPECRAGCVSESGHGGRVATQRARAARTVLLHENPPAFMALVYNELDRFQKRNGGSLGCRPNAFSDIAWEYVMPSMFAWFPRIYWYDYTKRWDRVDLPSNYHLVYSASERTTLRGVESALDKGRNVAIVFGVLKGEMPEEFNGWPVIDGDKTDFRYGDPTGVIVGLSPKGRMLKTSGRYVTRPGGFIKSIDPREW